MVIFIVDKVNGVIRLHKDHCGRVKKASVQEQFTGKNFSIAKVNQIIDKPWAILPCKTCFP